MSLVAPRYSLGPLEAVVGSITFGICTLWLLPLTSACTLGLLHVAGGERKRGHLGFQGVLAAWLVVAACRLPRYCLLPGVDATCVRKWGLPGNAAPLAVLAGLGVGHSAAGTETFHVMAAGACCGVALVLGGFLDMYPSLWLLFGQALAMHAIVAVVCVAWVRDWNLFAVGAGARPAVWALRASAAALGLWVLAKL